MRVPGHIIHRELPHNITAAAGVPKGSFYNHFDSKEALGAEVVGEYWEGGACSTLRILSDQTLAPVDV